MEIAPWKIAALYKFFKFTDYQEFAENLKVPFESLGIRGTLILAEEGINGTIAGTPDNLNQAIALLKLDSRLRKLDLKFSFTDSPPFGRFKVKVKTEIVTFRQPGIDPQQETGTYLEAEAWNDLISAENVTLVDTRNSYEVEIGKFPGAIDPGTADFTEFAYFVDEHLNPDEQEHVAMYCTGGIRCEKATALLLQKGFKNVYHLKGGILRYLETVKSEKLPNKWTGDCFVFDERVAVDADLAPAGYRIDPVSQKAVKLKERGRSVD